LVGEPPAAIRDFRPDGLVLDTVKKRLYVIEFSRGMQEDPEAWLLKDAVKTQAYHGLVIHLQRHYTGDGYRVEQFNFLMGVLCSIEEDRWDRQLKATGVKQGQLRAVKKACLRAGAEALHLVCNCHRSALVGLRTGPANALAWAAPSQRDRPPAT